MENNYKSKLIFCALLETALKVRGEFHEQDVLAWGDKQAEKIANSLESKKGDKKWINRNMDKLMGQVQSMRGDKIVLEQRLNILINGILKSLPAEEQKKYPGVIEFLNQQINESK